MMHASHPHAAAPARPLLMIVGDDLSGATDCAAGFASAGRRSVVSLDLRVPDGAEVFAVDTDSRALPSAEAVSRVRAALAARLTGALIYKKIDSTLRGHLAEELAEALAALPDVPGAILAPAFPAQGRSLVDGRCRIHDEPLADTALWRGAGIAGPADPAPRLAAAGLASRVFPAVQAGHEAASACALAEAFSHGVKVAICDAATEDDLDRLAAALEHLEVPPLLVGSAGLARALARRQARRGRASLAPASAGERDIAALGRQSAPDGYPAPGRHPAAAAQPAATPAGVLTVIGSRAPIARAQAAAILDATGALLLHAPIEVLLGSPGSAAALALAGQAGEALAAGRHVVLGIAEGPVDHGISLSLARGLAAVAAPAAQHAAGLVLTGGDTARAVLQALSVDAIEVLAEVEPGVPIARPCASESASTSAPAKSPPWLCLKAGGFGGPDTLQAAVQLLESRITPSPETHE